MKSAEYWQQRSEQVAKLQHEKTDAYITKVKREYDRALKTIKADIDSFHRRFAVNNEISMAEARKLLTKGELKEFRMTLEEFTAKAKDNADGRWTQMLNNVYYRTRITRLEALQIQIRQQAEMLAGGEQTGTRALLKDVYSDTYYRTMYELQKGTGFGASFARLDPDGLEKVTATEWLGSNYSKRIWGNRNKLVNELRTRLAQSIIRGDSADRMTDMLAERMGVAKSNAARLIRTESSFMVGEATAAAYFENGIVDKYEILATLDGKTSAICRGMDGHVFELRDREVNVNYPPFHSNCRTTVVPFFHEEIDAGERIARDEEGKSYFVPGDIKYEDWKKQYVDSPNPPKSGIIDQISYRKFSNVAELKEWENKVTPPWLDSLSEDERKSIVRYTGSSYVEINENLRNGGGQERYDELARYISAGINKFELKDNITVYRGMRSNIFGVPAEDLVGVEFTEKAFWSTSMIEEKQFSGLLQMEIRVPAKSRGAPINPLSEYKDEEYEFLLDAGTHFRIVEASEEDGRLKLIVEVIADAD
ncbi:ADP-ribosyltransferase [Paenibacillus flagellatus]|uniref:Phage head morphogenesis protein n=1 Tax=Paenibacillus flagellatus TaxID=2211139 RepID=A0A2V5KBT9_9BACL|nr:ADP-ribosyltransferase [Paenibacillus flagellatus]PYI57031.1 phage head morphogenesis protein [Paenibacillus flagellatus]